MAKVAVFDSGLGSLSIIRPLRRAGLHIIYFADQQSFPYGTKSSRQLGSIIRHTIKKLDERFSPDIIVVASNTPSLLLGPPRSPRIIGVLPPLRQAARLTSTKKIAVLATRSATRSRTLQHYIQAQVPKNIRTFKVDASPLVALVESGTFPSRKDFCRRKIAEVLGPAVAAGADVATLSSTHLPFLLPLLEESFPQVRFLDPAESVASKVIKSAGRKPARGKLEIFASGSPKSLERKLAMLGIRKKVSRL